MPTRLRTVWCDPRARAGVVTLTTDFGLRDGFAGVMAGVIIAIAPTARIVSISHGIPRQDVRAGAFVLEQAVPYFPRGTVHVGVVDPGVGTSRRLVAVRAGGHFLVGPDNGLLGPAIMRLGGVQAAVAIKSRAHVLQAVSHTFHGRDVLAPIAAHLCRGLPLARLGPPVAPPTLSPSPYQPAAATPTEIRGEVIYVDHFGNLITNIDEALWQRQVREGSFTIAMGAWRGYALHGAYAGIPASSAGAIFGSHGRLEIAVNGGNAAILLGLGIGCAVSVSSQASTTPP